MKPGVLVAGKRFEMSFKDWLWIEALACFLDFSIFESNSIFSWLIWKIVSFSSFLSFK